MSQLIAFLVIPGLSAISPFLVLPTLVAVFGLSAWTSVAIASSLGAGGAVVAELGWGVVGPQQIARTPERSLTIYRQSVATKLIGISVALIGTEIATLALVRTDVGTAALVAAGTVFNVLAPSWYFTGQGRPFAILVTDTLPRLGLLAVAVVGMRLGGPIFLYGLALVAAPALSYSLGSRLGGLPVWPGREGFDGAGLLLRRQFIVIVGRAVSTLYTSLPTALIAIVSHEAVPTFSGADRPMRIGITVLQGFPNRLQSWVGSASRSNLDARIRVVLWANLALGLVAGAVYIASANFVVLILFSGKVQLPFAVVVLEGALATAICASRGFGLALVARDRANHLTYAVVAAAAIGVGCILPLTHAFGAAGAIAALLLAELVGISVQSLGLSRGRGEVD